MDGPSTVFEDNSACARNHVTDLYVKFPATICSDNVAAILAKIIFNGNNS